MCSHQVGLNPPRGKSYTPSMSSVLVAQVPPRCFPWQVCYALQYIQLDARWIALTAAHTMAVKKLKGLFHPPH